MEPKKLHDILDLIGEFALVNPHVFALGLCGSRARGTARPNSDIDLSILVQDKQIFRETDWLEQLKFEKINDKISRFEDKTYGKVWSRHVFLESQAEIEFSFADKSWAATDPLNEGTHKVISDGYKIIYDPHLILEKLVEKVRGCS